MIEGKGDLHEPPFFFAPLRIFVDPGGMNNSHQILWHRYRRLDPSAPLAAPPDFHFCDNQSDADLCADLVVRGIKRATASSLIELELIGQPLPKAGDLSLVTDWKGRARALIRTRQVDIRRLGDIDATFAALEGEGDGSLAWWRKTHLAYYQRVLAGSGVHVDEDLLIACEVFDCLISADG